MTGRDKIKVVIVDDEPETVSLLAAFLGLFDCEPHGVYTGQAGLKAVAEHRPDVLILDLMLPDIDGLEVCRQLRQQPDTHSLPIVILSARTSPEDVKLGYAAGATRYLKKPIDLDTLLEEVRRVAALKRHQAPSEAEQQADADHQPHKTRRPL